MRIIIGTIFRLFPLSVEPGLRVFGHPDEKSLVFVTANFDLTVRRLARYLTDIDCYLLIAPTGGINVWCAAVGGNFTAHSVISIVKNSGISDRVSNRTLILPQLAAPGVDVVLVQRETGWNCKFGPVYAKDIPEYIATGFRKADRMRRVVWPLADRLDVGLGISIPLLLPVMVILAIFLRAWLIEFIILGFGLVILMYGFHPIIPGKAGWHKLLFLEVLLGVGLVSCVFLDVGDTAYIRDLFFTAMGLVLVIGIDLAGATPLQKSELDSLMDKLGIRHIGPINYSGRFKIVGSKIALDSAKCTTCGICFDVCPRGVFEMVKDEHGKIVIKYPELCEVCEACILQCPEGALYFVT